MMGGNTKTRLGWGVSIALAVTMSTASSPVWAGEPESTTPVDDAAPEPATEPATEPPAQPPSGGMNDPGLWNALSGNELQLTLTDGSFRGKLMGMQGNQLVLARSGDGLVVSVPTSEVLRVYAPMDRHLKRKPLPIDNGGGLIAGGSVLLGIGIPAVVAGAVMAGLLGGVPFIYLPLLIPGGAMTGAGAGMVKVGVDRKRMWQEATFGGRLADANGSPLQMRGMTLRF